MARSAREVLNDCRDALADFEHGVPGSKWRRWWVTNVALLRTVGYVLKKVDAKSDTIHDQAIAEAWPRIKAAPVFSAFIELERNNVLKTYKIGAIQVVSATPRAITLNAGSRVIVPPVSFRYLIVGGPFDGFNQADLIAQAIKFWSDHLDAIDKRVVELKSAPP